MTPEQIAQIQARMEFCRTYKFGMVIADKLAHEDVPALLAYARDLEAQLKGAKVTALREAADDMDEVIACGDVAEVAAPVEGGVGRQEAISGRDSLYEEPSHWLRGYADALEDETIRAALTATEGQA